MADIAGNSSTTATAAVGSTIIGSLELPGDRDWFRIDLSAGQSITVGLSRASFNGVEDPFLRLFDSAGGLLYENDDGGGDGNALLSFTAVHSGLYFIEAGSFAGQDDGEYQLSVGDYTPPPLGTFDDVAYQLVHGYWAGHSRRFDVTQGGSIAVDLTALAPEGRTLAREALALWSDIIGITFVEVASAGQITFGDLDDGAFADAISSGGIISSAHVNVSAEWLAEHGSDLNSYSFQTYVHAIGTALGLGHAGNYNGDARYPYDALFQIDGWPASVMSEFDQRENSYFADQGFSQQFVLTPMVSDILAMSMLYGLSAATRFGDTIYGFNSNAGRSVFDASVNPGVSYAIYDSGGNDTLDYSGFTEDQLIELVPERFSNIGGRTGNVTIARGVVIENAIGGSGNDTINGNAAANVLSGGAGHDVIDGGDGDDLLYGGAGYDTIAGGAGNDTLHGGDGDDALNGGSGQDSVYGEAGEDIITASGNPFALLAGGAGNDTITASSGTYDILGDDGNDQLTLNGGGSSSALDGGAGDDRIWAAGTGTLSLAGGSGNDDITVQGFSGGTVSLGEGNDVATMPAGLFTIHLGGGRDRIVIDELASGFTTLTGFNAGEHGDQLDLSVYGPDPFGSGALAITQDGPDTIIIADGMQYVIRDVLAANLSAYNLGIPNPAYSPVGLTIHGADAEDPGLDVPDELVGADGNDTIRGHGGSDLLLGGGGNDSIEGGVGDDVLTGGSGADILAGGSGSDLFRDTAAGLNGDTIQDFGRDDAIVITDADISAFSFSASGNILTFSGGSLRFDGVSAGPFVAKAASGGGVELRLDVNSAPSGARNDFDGDGRSDILWRNDTGLVSNWLGQANGAFALNDHHAQLGQSTALTVAASGDFSGDGRADVLWRASDGWLSMWTGLSNGGWETGYAPHAGASSFKYTQIAQPPADWKIVGSGDFNGDGRDDLLWRSDGGALSDWLSNGNGTFTINDANAFAQVPTSWRVVGTGDFNGDGRDDVLWRSDTGQLSNWLGLGNGGFVPNDSNAFASVPTSWHVVGAGDFNGDGRDDVLWRSDTGQLSNWLGQPNGGFAPNDGNAFASVPTDWHIADVGDYDGDGRDDILWRSDTGQLSNWLGQPNGGFAPNDGNAFASVPTSWTVQSPDSLWL